jgi:hypothetical protein
MPKWIAAVLVSGCLCAPNVAFALSDQDQFRDIVGISKEQALVVGAGIIAGALVVHLVVPADFAYLAGGVGGGLAANWWYQNGGEAQLRPLLKLDRASAVANAPRGPVLEGVALGR